LEYNTIPFHFRPQGFEIVDLTIKNDAVSAIGRGHWLVTRSAQIKNGKTRIHQARVAVSGKKQTLIVWSAMAQGTLHGKEPLFESVSP